MAKAAAKYREGNPLLPFYGAVPPTALGGDALPVTELAPLPRERINAAEAAKATEEEPTELKPGAKKRRGTPQRLRRHKHTADNDG